jgi:hypothetical protein
MFIAGAPVKGVRIVTYLTLSMDADAAAFPVESEARAAFQAEMIEAVRSAADAPISVVRIRHGRLRQFPDGEVRVHPKAGLHIEMKILSGPSDKSVPDQLLAAGLQPGQTRGRTRLGERRIRHIRISSVSEEVEHPKVESPRHSAPIEFTIVVGKDIGEIADASAAREAFVAGLRDDLCYELCLPQHGTVDVTGVRPGSEPGGAGGVCVDAVATGLTAAFSSAEDFGARHPGAVKRS